MTDKNLLDDIFDKITVDTRELNKKSQKLAEEEAEDLNLSDPGFLNKVASGKWTLSCLQHSFTFLSLIIAISVVFTVGIRVYHLLAPENWSWLTFSQLSDLDKLITFVAIGITARYLPMGTLRKEDKDDRIGP